MSLEIKMPVFFAITGWTVVCGIFSSWICYYAVGGVMASFWTVTYLFVLILYSASFFTKSFQRFALGCLILLLAFTVPLQMYNAYKLYVSDKQANVLVASLLELSTQKKPLPDSITDLPVSNKNFLSQIQSYDHKENKINLCYYVSDPSTSYCYSSDTGWAYQDD